MPALCLMLQIQYYAQNFAGIIRQTLPRLLDRNRGARRGNSYIREFSNDDGDGNKNFKKAIGLLSKTISLHVHHAFLYISLPLLHDYEVKMPSFTFYGGRKQATTNFSFSF